MNILVCIKQVPGTSKVEVDDYINIKENREKERAVNDG
jgi:electron transfer flavoprotein alpha/beta subunit